MNLQTGPTSNQSSKMCNIRFLKLDHCSQIKRSLPWIMYKRSLSCLLYYIVWVFGYMGICCSMCLSDMHSEPLITIILDHFIKQSAVYFGRLIKGSPPQNHPNYFPMINHFRNGAIPIIWRKYHNPSLFPILCSTKWHPNAHNVTLLATATHKLTAKCGFL